MRLVILMALFWTGVMSCATTGKDTRGKQDLEKLANITREEREVGYAMAGKLAGTFGSFDSDEQLLRYLNLLGNSLALQSNRPEINYRFGILKSLDSNAFATPGGYVFITLGLLKSIRSESELAGVLSHEIIHVTERHMYKAIMPQRDVSVGESVTRMLSRGGSELGFNLGQVVNAGLDMLLEKGLGHDKEIEADQLGILLTSSGGYDQRAYYELLVRMSQQSATTKSLEKTHPTFPDRLKLVRAFMDSNGLPKGSSVQDPEMIVHRFKTATASLAVRAKK